MPSRKNMDWIFRILQMRTSKVTYGVYYADASSRNATETTTIDSFLMTPPLKSSSLEELAVPDLANEASEREDVNFEQNVLGELSLTEEEYTAVSLYVKTDENAEPTRINVPVLVNAAKSERSNNVEVLRGQASRFAALELPETRIPNRRCQNLPRPFSCACGSVKVTLLAPPDYAIRCHCETCREMHQEASVGLVLYLDPANVVCKEGNESLTEYRYHLAV
ncbi:hypothetical protein GUITHDRAFT_144324 [Guillardia theta CCMP2712]|uniref:CENP-V/GFA domain-containing protein n=1 Tax=Guillardia theta (strain CCMP2712) TaxID=905079 RepID=L1IQ82_GUITC|nr:hypothetical protein GUITHDRAFT_144324 [Guillardia theta CCMP2712]EKX38403.1 hypothetical protein GUITHDRAFT_144324 [Guillardia theta CCMP2712]|eukprot:XP_005825383.1 hypothetical protein GUITHDRAFT_144324 [Guillardia theta CCMP2712]